MIPKLVLVIFLVVTGFEGMQSMQLQRQSFIARWPQNADMLKMKQMKTKWNMEFIPLMRGGRPIVEPEMSSEETQEVESMEEMIVVNKVKREVGEFKANGKFI